MLSLKATAGILSMYLSDEIEAAENLLSDLVFDRQVSVSSPRVLNACLENAWWLKSSMYWRAKSYFWEI